MFKMKHVVMRFSKMVIFICLVSNTFAANRSRQHWDLDSPQRSFYLQNLELGLMASLPLEMVTVYLHGVQGILCEYYWSLL
jgi:hypothetical protein